MSATADQLFLEALALSPEARAELTDRLVASAAETLLSEIGHTHLEEVDHRLAKAKSGEVEPVSGEQVIAEGRRLLAALSQPERLQLVEDLWDNIVDEGESLPLPDWKIEELRRRKERFLQNPASGRTWEQVKQRARAQAQHD